MAEKFDWENIGKKLLEAAGGKANVKSFFHCATRFRFEVIDDKKISKDALRKVPLAKGVNTEGSQWQVIFGAGTVNKVTDAFTKVIGESEMNKQANNTKKVRWNRNLSFKANFFMNMRAGVRAFADIFIPLIPVFIAGGLALALSSLIGQAPVNGTSKGAKAVFDLIGGGILGSLPAFVGYTAMKKFGGTPMLGLAIGIIMVAPSLLNGWVGSGNYVVIGFDYKNDQINQLKNEYIINNSSVITDAYQGLGKYQLNGTLPGLEGNITQLGKIIDGKVALPLVVSFTDANNRLTTTSVDLHQFALIENLEIRTAYALFPTAPAFFSFSLVGYQAQVFPILGVMILAYWVERLMRRYSPEAIAIVSVPLVTVLVSIFFGFLIIGPAGKYIGIGISIAFQSIYKYTNWPGFGLGGAIIGAVYPWLVVTGLHQGLIPIEATLIAETATAYNHSFTWITPIASVANVAQGMVGLAIAIMVWKKAPSIRGKAISGSVSANLGITEPVLFGVNLPSRFGLFAASAAAAVGGYWVGMTHTVAASLGSASWLGLVQFDFTLQQSYSNYLNDYGFNTTPGLRELAPAVNIIIAMVLTSIAAFGFTYLFAKTFGKKGLKEFVAQENQIEAIDHSKSLSHNQDIKVVAPLSGTFAPHSAAKDKTFKSGLLGTGVVIYPTKGEIVAPITGRLVMVSPDKTAYTFQSADGTLVFIHLGVEVKKLTVDLKINNGDEVVSGAIIAQFSLHELKEKAQAVETLVVVTSETINGRKIDISKAKNIHEGDLLFSIAAKPELSGAKNFATRIRKILKL